MMKHEDIYDDLNGSCHDSLARETDVLLFNAGWDC